MPEDDLIVTSSSLRIRSSASPTIVRGIHATSLITLPVQAPRWSIILRTSDSSSARGRPLSMSVAGSGGTASGAASLARPIGAGLDTGTTGVYEAAPFGKRLSAGGVSTSIDGTRVVAGKG